MQGTNLLNYCVKLVSNSFIICVILLYTLTPFMFFDNCIGLGNYVLFCELVYFCRGWQRSKVREVLHASLGRSSFSFSQSGARVMSRVSFI